MRCVRKTSERRLDHLKHVSARVSAFIIVSGTLQRFSATVNVVCSCPHQKCFCPEAKETDCGAGD